MEVRSKQIAKNTFFLYFRKALTIFIGLYSSRLLLKYLGVDDYGLYGLAGGVVLMFSAVRAMFTDSIQRYINVEKGKQVIERIRLVFTYGVILNGIIAVIFIIGTEIAGCVIFPNLRIPQEDVPIAFWILQFSILSAVISIMTVPFDAVMIANEKFNAYAGFSILSSLLNLVSVMLLCLIPEYRVVYYASFTFIVALIIRVASAIYCKRQFAEETKYCWKKDLELFKEMTFFSGWNFFGNIAYSIYDEGINLILNLFGGLPVNGARTIAVQIRQTISQFNLEALAGFKPQLMGSYGNGDVNRFILLLNQATKFSFFISALLSVIMTVFTPAILKMWLGEIPEYTIDFIRCIMLYMVIRGVHAGIDLLFKTIGKLRQYQLWECGISLFTLPLAWMALKVGMPYYSVFIVACICETIKLFGDIILIKRILNISPGQFIRGTLLRCMFASVVLCIIVVPCMSFDSLKFSWPVLVGLGLVAIFITIVVMALTLYNRVERQSLVKIIRK